MTNEEILEVLTPLKKLVVQLETKLEQQTAAREAVPTTSPTMKKLSLPYLLAQSRW